MKAFLSPATSLGDLDSGSASRLAAAAGDISFVLDPAGLVRDVAHYDATLAQEIGVSEHWLGRSWFDCVTVESRPKIAQQLRDAVDGRPPRWLHINHPSASGHSIPMQYLAVRAGSAGNLVVLGRDLRAASAMQQRLVDAQQSMERDYLRLRHVETRYRLLFELSSEAVVVIDAQSQRTSEANPVALALLADAAAQVIGRPFVELFAPADRPPVEALLTLVRTAGRAEEVETALERDGRRVRVSASLFRQENAALVLARVIPVGGGEAAAPVSPADATLLLAVENAPDGFVVTEPDGRILAANAAFLDMVQLGAEDQAREGRLDEWLGRAAVDMNVMAANLRQRGSVRLFQTTLRGRFGASTDVEISGVSVLRGGKTCVGVAIRNVGRRLPALGAAGRETPRSVEQLTELIGRVSLKELVREATDMIEKLGIEAALQLTDDNKASAAELLGLSRQSLYVKLRRYGLGELGNDADE